MADKIFTVYDAQTMLPAGVRLVDAGAAHLVGVDASALAEIVEVTLSLDTSEYLDGDVLAATQEIADFFPVDGGKRRLISATVNDKDAVGEAFDLVLMRSNISIGAENAAADCDPDDADEILAKVKIEWDDFIDLTSCKVATVPAEALNILLKAAAGETSLWIAAISRGVATHTAAGITLKLGVV